MGEVAKSKLSPEFDFSPFWLPFDVRFKTENAHKIMFWLTLEALVNKKATNICNDKFNAIFKRLFYEKVTQGPPTRSPKGGPAAGAGMCGAWVKRPILRKACLNPRESVITAR